MLYQTNMKKEVNIIDDDDDDGDTVMDKIPTQICAAVMAEEDVCKAMVASNYSLKYLFLPLSPVSGKEIFHNPMPFA